MKQLSERISRLIILSYIYATCFAYNMTNNPSNFLKVCSFISLLAWGIYINSDSKD